MLSEYNCVSWEKEREAEMWVGGGGRKCFDPPTRRGSQFDQSAQERMIIKNPTARTKESKMTAGEMLGCN